VSAAILLSAYALAVAWCVPALLVPLTRRGISARLGVAAWLTAIASALASAAAALAFLVSAAVTGGERLAAALCQAAAGKACTPALYRSALFEAALSGAAVIAALAVAVLIRRYGHNLQRSRRRTRAHAEAVRITGSRLAGTGTAVVLDVPQAAAYCVPGRPATIVLTTGAMAVLDSAQLAAVLAHERAHLAGRHHLLVALTRGFAAIFPAFPLFARGHQQVARLAEMSADDAAIRHSGRPALIAALLTMGTGTAVPAAGLSASGCAVIARLHRLLEPPPPARHLRYALALAGMTILLAATSALFAAFAGPLAGHALTIG
jgi:Zn-dependent protease with chaperone function